MVYPVAEEHEAVLMRLGDDRYLGSGDLDISRMERFRFAGSKNQNPPGREGLFLVEQRCCYRRGMDCCVPNTIVL